MRIFVVVSYFLVLSFPTLGNSNSITTPIVNIEMTENGFHRNLVYTVQFDYPLAGKECEYMLEQQLPAAVYVSVDQLDDLKRLKKLDAIFPSFVDIEKATDKSEPFAVLLKGTPRITDTITLPIHFRYHPPSAENSFVTVEIPIPKMYINCPDEDDELIDSELQTISSTYCLQGDGTFSDSSLPSEACDWKLIKVDYQLKSSMRAEIPVGNAKAYPFVLYATIIISWVVSLYTIFRTRHVPRRINMKLEEQRILQKKGK